MTRSSGLTVCRSLTQGTIVARIIAFRKSEVRDLRCLDKGSFQKNHLYFFVYEYDEYDKLPTAPP